jgi:hypothetical protein
VEDDDSTATEQDDAEFTNGNESVEPAVSSTQTVTEATTDAFNEDTPSAESTTKEIDEASTAPFDEPSSRKDTKNGEVSESERLLVQNKADDAIVEASVVTDKSATIDDTLALELGGDGSDAEDSLLSM